MEAESAPLLDAVTDAVQEELQRSGLWVPRWLVRELAHSRLPSSDRRPRTGDDGYGDAACTAAVRGIVAELEQCRQDRSDDVHVLGRDDVGLLLAALGIVTHATALNSDHPPVEVAGMLADVSACLVGLGSAVRESQRLNVGPVLVPHRVVVPAHRAVSVTVRRLHDSTWVVTGPAGDPNPIMQTLRAALQVLPPIETP